MKTLQARIREHALSSLEQLVRPGRRRSLLAEGKSRRDCRRLLVVALQRAGVIATGRDRPSL